MLNSIPRNPRSRNQSLPDRMRSNRLPANRTGRKSRNGLLLSKLNGRKGLLKVKNRLEPGTGVKPGHDTNRTRTCSPCSCAMTTG